MLQTSIESRPETSYPVLILCSHSPYSYSVFILRILGSSTGWYGQYMYSAGGPVPTQRPAPPYWLTSRTGRWTIDTWLRSSAACPSLAPPCFPSRHLAMSNFAAAQQCSSAAVIMKEPLTSKWSDAPPRYITACTYTVLCSSVCCIVRYWTVVGLTLIHCHVM
jgi:hypothetical protein